VAETKMQITNTEAGHKKKIIVFISQLTGLEDRTIAQSQQQPDLRLEQRQLCGISRG